MVQSRTDPYYYISVDLGYTLYLVHLDIDRLSNPPAWYSIVCAGLVVFIILCFITRLAFQWLASRITDAILKYLVYSTVSLFRTPKWRFSVKDLLFPVLCLSANGVCMG